MPRLLPFPLKMESVEELWEIINQFIDFVNGNFEPETEEENIDEGEI